ncbi:RNA 2',3'-cyclic phosphodiesterase [Candidatus Peregrinibacteria bacterium]|jgi:RNA 2',3'-cyclic 3'-phosphodiesterase|nr:RNA 2',3'-cyclic phosphodiesterase [Candidatus Peregrinibacteria bacterium]MBT7483921.1 RNA 2',3'-cyclic phosphodiesterase [Candidatus Peregrinibacteria bacterium]MBT7703052.1 RNA 2',3'-cyclic phosphodiesterase [Candidatus Peregrinibacteria bacterium]
MEEKERYFFALNIPEEMIKPLKLAQDHLPQDGIRYSLTNYFHVSLKFLGELPDLKEMGVRLKAKEIAQKVIFSEKDLEMSFGKAGVFFRGGQPSVVWAGVYLPPALLDFQRNLTEGLNQIGFAIEKKRFRPHITLARVRDVKGLTTETIEKMRRLGVQRRSFKLDKFYLMKSHLKPNQAPEYKIIEEYRFNKG